ncbi:putative Transcriptional regulator, IclR family [Desulfosarcina cetonica]|uniref:IclR family transcriptional regulator n=1 Tax=Desulfosarcina cetonica TaxID=90730 RepID=UPI0006D2BB45|nr:IclR family transcriptional regulator [Desulfosarcina cetonica]VTR67259.1 putative Transcriptional regulator, IclR family [Desulfosarcina cetonica]
MTRHKKTTPKDKYMVPAVEQAMRVLFRIAQSESAHMNLTEICEKTEIHKSTAFCILQTLRKYGIVQTAGRGKGYALGPGLIGLSRRFLDSLSMPKLAEPLLTDLATKAGATAALGLIADQNVFVAAKHEGSHPMGVTMRVGHRFPLTYGCHGKAIVAFLPEAEREALLASDALYFHGDPSRFDREKLNAEIIRCQEDGYAMDLEETVPGINAVAAPVIGPNQQPVGYLVVLGLSSVEGVYECGRRVAAAGKSLSRQLGAEI